MKIAQLEIENVKRVKAVRLSPAQNGLTVIGGRNNQGKTSVLDSIAWALGGDRYRPSQASREGSVVPPRLHIIMDNGLVVERKGKNSDLTVTDPTGRKGGQQLLNEFVEQLAIDLPKFMESTSREKARTLLQIIGLRDELDKLDREENELYNRRHAIGQIADQKAKFAKEMTYYPDAPAELISPSDLIKKQQDILARNGENQRKRLALEKIKEKVAYLERQLNDITVKYSEALSDLETARKSAEDLHDESTAELEESIRSIEMINLKVRANLDRDKASEDAAQYRVQYDTLTSDLMNVRKKKTDLLGSAPLPLKGLSVDNGELTYNGQQWDNMSGSDQLKVSTAIVRKLNPNCGFVLIDKLEQMDLETMKEFGMWLEAEGLQAIATRVSTGGECSIIISDGYIAGEEPQQKTWTEGEF